MNTRLIGGILLVAGTTIGAGMLALPVSTGLAGFIPAMMLMTLCWAYMLFTALLMLEVTLWMGPHANLISMSKDTLGRPGQVVSWIAYLFLLYALTTAYIAGSGPIIANVITLLTGFTITPYLGSLPLLLLFGLCVYKGTAVVDHINRILMVGLVLSFVALLSFLMPELKLNYLLHIDWKPLFVATSVIVTSFGFHIIIPTLSHYLEYDTRQIRLAIVIGSAIPFLVYAIWEFFALAIIPLDSLQEGYQQGLNGAQLISKSLNSSIITIIDRFFSLFAIITSFLGVSLSLSDFLADGLKIKKTRGGRILLYLLTFIPPVLIAYSNPRIFLTALEYAGAFGVIVLLGLLPALMVWRGRYQLGHRGAFMAPGGRAALLIVIVLSLVAISLEIANQLNYLRV